MDPRTGPSIATVSGLEVRLLSPQEGVANIRDISHSLSNLCRFAGHTSRFYSVAEHSVLVAHLVGQETDDLEVEVAALYHDAHETYLGEVTSPLKLLLEPTYSRLAELWDREVARLVGIHHDLFSDPLIREMDERAAYIEAGRLMNAPWAWDWEDARCKVPEDIYWYGGLDPGNARHAFRNLSYGLGVPDGAF